HGIGRQRALGDAAGLDRGHGDGVHTMRKWSTSVQRRMRVKLIAVVIPSPVGLAIVKLVGPSPPMPSPAKLGPFLTKIEQLHARAILDSLSMLRECIEAVCRKLCSTSRARSIPSSTVGTRVMGRIGIIISVH